MIEIHTCSFRSLRGYTCIGAAVDEVAFWSVEDSANPDKEVLVALRAAMASVPEAMLIGLNARRGEVWRIFEKHFGKDSPDVLVVNGSTTTMNPTIDAKVIAAAYEDDPVAAAAEYGAESRRDVEVFLRSKLWRLSNARTTGTAVSAPAPLLRVSRSGRRHGHGLHDDGDCPSRERTRHPGSCTEIRPPLSPEATVAEFATVFKS